MAIDPGKLSTTAVMTFEDNFNSFDYWNGRAGTWDTGYPWTEANGGTNAANAEQQWYVNANYAPTASLGTYSATNGIMNIKAAPTPTALRSHVNDYAYTSGMITTFHSFSQTYGYFEMRAKLPAGQGLWPAFWLLPTDLTWPPEIDIMEMIGSKPNQLETTVHYDSGGHKMSNKTTIVEGMTTGFHTYAVDWQSDTITWYFDGAKVHQVATPASMNKPMYMLANLAVGGDWAGSPDASTRFPATYEIDYIRAYAAASGQTSESAPQVPQSGTERPLPVLPASSKTKKSHYGTYEWDTLWGTKTHDKIVGREGGDTMLGRNGDDTYLVEHSGDRAVEKANGGIDTVRTDLAKFKLSANVENLVLTGKGDQSGYGNNLSNKIYSNKVGDNILSGGGGNDQLFAGRFADTLIGGGGSDQFIFATAPKRAGTIKDFQLGVDILDLRGVFQGSGDVDPVSAGRLSFDDNGAGDTVVRYKTTAGAILTITTLDNIAPSMLQPKLDYFYV